VGRVMLSVFVILLAALAAPATEWSIAIHGGAGGLARDTDAETVAAYRASLERVLALGSTMLAEGAQALDVVEAVLRDMEDDPLYNAGKGSVYTHERTQEMDAAIMDGRDRSCGAVTGLKTFPNPITVARRVMDSSPHVFMAGEGAAAFARSQGIEEVGPEYFYNEKRLKALEKALEKDEFGAVEPGSVDDKYGTVGCVVRDVNGDLAAGTTTGGITNKRFGRIGDVPVIGAGTYADNPVCAISGTGKGERYIANTVARTIAAYVEFAGLSLQDAVHKVLHEVLVEGDGGIIAVGADGTIVMDYNTISMFRAAANQAGHREVRIWEE